MTQDMEKAEVPNAFFPSVLTSKISLPESQAVETRAKVWSKKNLCLVEEDQVREYLCKQDIHKSLGPHGMYPSVEGAG